MVITTGFLSNSRSLDLSLGCKSPALLREDFEPPPNNLEIIPRF